MSVVDEIKQRLDIVDVIGAHVRLTKAGRNFKGLCPFHTEKTPSFIVFPETQTWHCFGSCGTGGDMFTFVMRQENVEFPEALRMLAERAGVQLGAIDQESVRRGEEIDRMRETNRAAAEFYHDILVNQPEGEPGRAYFARRGVSAETMRAFQLGYAPDEWHKLEERLTRERFTQRELLDAGLLSSNEAGRRWDRFRGRIMFPIRGIRGHVLGFGGRVLDDSVPKYLNTPQTPLFDKGAILYGIDLARLGIRDSGTAVIVEGYMDVIVPYQEGVGNVVAVMGTALSDSHIKVLKRLAKRLVLALDPDAAGLAAVERGTATARENLPRRTVPILDARGLVRYEERMDAEIRIMTLPDGLDPDELVLADRPRWDELVDGALPVAEHFFQRARIELDVSDAKGKRAAATRLTPVIAAIESPVERGHYVQQLSQWLHAAEQSIWAEVDQHRAPGKRHQPTRRRQRPSADPQPLQATPPDLGLALEEHILTLLLRTPALITNLVASGYITEQAFADVRHRVVFQTLCKAPPDGTAASLEQFADGLDTPSREHVESLLQRASDRPPLDVDVAREDLLKSSARLVQRRLLGRIDQLRFALQDAHQESLAERETELRAEIKRLMQVLQETNRHHHEATMVGKRPIRD